MKAIVYTKYISPDVLEFKEVVKPTSNDDVALVKVITIFVNEADLHLFRADQKRIRLSVVWSRDRSGICHRFEHGSDSHKEYLQQTQCQ